MNPHSDNAEIGPTALTESLSLRDIVVGLRRRWKLLVLLPLAAGLIALAATFAIPETFTSRTTFIPPQQQNGPGAAAIASLGALSSLAGLGQGIRTSSDQYASLLESANVRDRLVDEFKLMDVYGTPLRVDARDTLASKVRISIGKKDGLMAVEVDDRSPQRAADIANRHVTELRRLTSQLALTEAQVRRTFFQREADQARTNLEKAQKALQATGFNLAALRAEPRAAAEAYSRLRAEVTSAEVKLQALRRSLTDQSVEVQTQMSGLAQMRAQLARVEDSTRADGGTDYTGHYREFKYQETLFELFSRQYELARLDEVRDGSMVQVVDVATPAERRSAPKRRVIAMAATAATALVTLLFFVVSAAWKSTAAVRRPAISPFG